MKMLVTGAAGFIGSHLCERLLDEGHTVLGVDSFTDYYPRSRKEDNLRQPLLHDRFTFTEGDLNHLDLHALLAGCGAVFHQAAQAGVRASWGREFSIYVDCNIRSTQRLLEACRDASVGKFIYASSSSVYGDCPDFPMREDSLALPVSPYGVSKLAAEHLCRLYWKNFGIPTVSLRYFTVYGARQRPDMAFHRFFRWIAHGTPIKLYGTGEQSRDFTHVSDIVNANLLALDKGEGGSVFNIGGGARISLKRVIEKIEEMVGRQAILDRRETQKGDVLHTSADLDRAAGTLGYAPEVSIDKGLADEWAWVRALGPMP